MRYYKKLTAALVLLAMLAGSAAFAVAMPPDIIGLPSQAAVEYLMDLGVVAGYPDGTIRPSGTITRAEAVKVIIVITYGDEETAIALAGQNPFNDVPGSHWASGHITLAKAHGIVEGHGDGTFGPDDPVTYAQYAKMLVEAAGLSGDAGLAWPDNYVTVAIGLGMIADIIGFAANAPAPRGDCFMMTAFTVQSVADPVTGLTLGQSVFGETAVTIVNVTQDTEHGTLAEAIEAATAGDTLEIPAGTVVGNVMIPEHLTNLTIRGAGVAETTITGNLTVEVTRADEAYSGASGLTVEGLAISGTLTVFQESIIERVEIGGDLVADPAGGAKIANVAVAGDMYIGSSEVDLENVTVAGDAYIGMPNINASHLTVAGAVFGAAVWNVELLTAMDEMLIGGMTDQAQDLYVSFSVGGDSGEYTGALEAGRTISLEITGIQLDVGAGWQVSHPEVLALQVDKIDDWEFVITLTVKDGQTLAANAEVVLLAPDAAAQTSDHGAIRVARNATAPWWAYQYRLFNHFEMRQLD